MFLLGRQKRVLNKLGRKTAVVIGLVERSEGVQVRFGRGKLLEEEILDKKETTFKVFWDDGTVDKLTPPPYNAIFLREDGGPVVFLYFQSPKVAVPLTSPVRAWKKLEFDDKSMLETHVKRLLSYNPKVEYKAYEENGKYILEYPVITFDLDRDVPIREHYARIVLRLLSKSIRKDFWSKWGSVFVTGATLVVMIVAFLLATGFVTQTVDVATKHVEKVIGVLEKVASNVSNVLNTSNKLLETAEKLVRMGGK